MVKTYLKKMISIQKGFKVNIIVNSNLQDEIERLILKYYCNYLVCDFKKMSNL